MGISQSFRNKLAKLSKVPTSDVDRYLRRSIRYLGKPFDLESIPLIAAIMKKLYKVDQNRQVTTANKGKFS